MISWNSSVNSGKLSPSASSASPRLISCSFQASSPRKPNTKLDKSSVPSPTLRILKPIPSNVSI